MKEPLRRSRLMQIHSATMVDLDKLGRDVGVHRDTDVTDQRPHPETDEHFRARVLRATVERFWPKSRKVVRSFQIEVYACGRWIKLDDPYSDLALAHAAMFAFADDIGGKFKMRTRPVDSVRAAWEQT